MIGQKRAESIIEQIISYAKGKAQGAEVSITASDIACSRFANNSMTQNQAPDAAQISLRLLKGGKQVRMSSDDLSLASAKKLVDDALIALKYLDKDPELLSLPRPAKGSQSKLNSYDRKTHELSAADRAAMVKRIIEIARKSNLSAAGIVETGANFCAIGNSEGLTAMHKESHAACSITMNKDGSTGWAKSDQVKALDLESESMAERAAQKALRNCDPIDLAPGKYRVILEPSAVLDLISFLSWDFAATSHIDKLSCFLGQLGKKVFGDNISISDDCRHPLQKGAPFDGEGLSRQPVKLIENGVLKNLVCGRRAAKKLGLKPTGHGLAEPNSEGEFPQNLVLQGGSSSLSEMIASQERAILLTRVWYIREVDPAKKIVTGMTRDGTFLVENGKLGSAVKNLRFNQSLVEMLNNVMALGPAQRAAGEEGLPSVVAPMLVDNFNFSSSTTF